MSYFRPRRPLSGVSTELPARLPARHVRTSSLGSLGGDAPGGNTLSQPTLADPATAAWQQAVIDQLQAGVKTLQTAELQKWLQVAATLAIPLSAVLWKRIAPHLFKKSTVPEVI